jgi:hypothetical protein
MTVPLQRHPGPALLVLGSLVAERERSDQLHAVAGGAAASRPDPGAGGLSSIGGPRGNEDLGTGGSRSCG